MIDAYGRAETLRYSPLVNCGGRCRVLNGAASRIKNDDLFFMSASDLPAS